MTAMEDGNIKIGSVRLNKSEDYQSSKCLKNTVKVFLQEENYSQGRNFSFCCRG